MKALVGAFNQEKALVGAFSVIVQPVVEPMDQFGALIVTGNIISGFTGFLLASKLLGSFLYTTYLRKKYARKHRDSPIIMNRV